MFHFRLIKRFSGPQSTDTWACDEASWLNWSWLKQHAEARATRCCCVISATVRLFGSNLWASRRVTSTNFASVFIVLPRLRSYLLASVSLLCEALLLFSGARVRLWVTAAKTKRALQQKTQSASLYTWSAHLHLPKILYFWNFKRPRFTSPTHKQMLAPHYHDFLCSREAVGRSAPRWHCRVNNGISAIAIFFVIVFCLYSLKKIR